MFSTTLHAFAFAIMIAFTVVDGKPQQQVVLTAHSSASSTAPKSAKPLTPEQSSGQWVPRYDYIDDDASYSFTYSVNDPERMLHMNKFERREGNVVHGNFSTLHSDGTIVTHIYKSGGKHGHVVKVVTTHDPSLAQRTPEVRPVDITELERQRQRYLSNLKYTKTLPAVDHDRFRTNTVPITTDIDIPELAKGDSLLWQPEGQFQGGVSQDVSRGQEVNPLFTTN